MNIWEWFTYVGYKIDSVVSTDPQKRADAEAHAESLWTVTHATQGMDKQINEAINAEYIDFTGIAGFAQDIANGVKTLGRNVWTGINGLFKNLPLIVVLIVVGIGIFYLYPILSKKKA